MAKHSFFEEKEAPQDGEGYKLLTNDTRPLGAYPTQKPSGTDKSDNAQTGGTNKDQTSGTTTPSTGTTTPTTGTTLPTYQKSDVVKQAESLLQQQLAQKPGNFQYAWQDQLNDTINKILNREKFSYDLNGDALYQQYKDSYMMQGQQAMADAMGQASAMTGGYGNSYAQTVGQQAYQGYLQGLNDKIPELYQLALSKYQLEGDELSEQATILDNLRQQAYSEHRNDVADYYTELERLTEDARYKATEEYNKYRDQISDAQSQREFELAQSQYYSTDSTSSTGQTYTYHRADDNGNYVYTDSNGKEHVVEPGRNPYTGTKNKDTGNGVFDNGYQPDNINGTKLEETGLTDWINGQWQTVYTASGKYWIWDDTRNKYIEYDAEADAE